MNDDVARAASSRPPDHYTVNGRETIDRIRDVLGDVGFYNFCIGTAMKYEDRAGLKGDAQEDFAKQTFYREMANHVIGLGPDPRSGRPNFKPYVRP